MNDVLDNLTAGRLARISKDDDRELEPFGLVDGEERDATLGEGVIGVLVFRFAVAKNGIEISAEQQTLEEIIEEHFGGNNRAVLIHELGEILGDEAHVTNGTFVDT